MATSTRLPSSCFLPPSKWESLSGDTPNLTPFRFLIPNAQLQSAGSLTSTISDVLSQCPSDVYVLVVQPGVSASDYTRPANAPTLARYMTASQKTSVRSSASIADVVGVIDTGRWQEVLEKDCGATTYKIDRDSMSDG